MVLPTLAGLQGFAEQRTGGEAIMPLNKLPSLMADAMNQAGGGNVYELHLHTNGELPNSTIRRMAKSFDKEIKRLDDSKKMSRGEAVQF